jgi:hypothetical protein
MTLKGNTTRNKNIQKKLDAMLPDPFDAKTNFRLEEEVKRMLTEQAKFFKLSRNELMRQVLTDFVLYQEDARKFGRNNFYKIDQALSRWIIERNEIEVVLKEVEKLNQSVQANSKSTEVQVMSSQIQQLAYMINLLHKRLL